MKTPPSLPLHNNTETVAQLFAWAKKYLKLTHEGEVEAVGVHKTNKDEGMRVQEDVRYLANWQFGH